MNLEHYKYFYFIGIGGIGMSALARYFKANGKHISGYDKTPTPLTDELISEGMNIHFEDNIDLIPEQVRDNSNETLVVYTPAIPSSQHELNYFSLHRYEIKKRAEVLGLLTEKTFTVAVAGTHGKTTTSSMIAYILNYSGKSCTAFLGGIAKNFNSNLLLTETRTESSVMVVEADEYDRSFLKLNPDTAVITSTDADHLDIYGSRESMLESYLQFSKNIKYGGRLFAKAGLGFSEKCTSYSVTDSKAKYFAKNIRIENHRYKFDIENSIEPIRDVVSGMPGLHNVENALAAAALTQYLGVSSQKIKEAIESFSGVKRRFDLQFTSPSLTYIDDYAHHPEELRACISSVKTMYPGEKITGIFQPHLFSRTRDFAEEFAESLSLLDRIILLNIYPARELPIAGITSEILLNKIKLSEKSVLSADEAIQEVRQLRKGVILTLGAGDIDQLVEPIKIILSTR